MSLVFVLLPTYGADMAYQLWNSLLNLNNVDIQIWCDDSWMKDTDPNGDVPMNGAPYQYWDGRPVGSSNDWISAAATNGPCRDSPQLNGITYPDLNSISVVTMCQGMMPQWLNSWNQGITLTNARQTVQPSTVSISDFYSIFSTTLLHEFTHAVNLFGNANLFFGERCLLIFIQLLMGSLENAFWTWLT
jgi:hypothetical protein